MTRESCEDAFFCDALKRVLLINEMAKRSLTAYVANCGPNGHKLRWIGFVMASHNKKELSAPIKFCPFCGFKFNFSPIEKGDNNHV